MPRDHAPAAARIVVFACGDPLRGDDSVAPVTVGQLPGQVRALADVRVVGALEVEHLADLPPGTRVVIVDAVVGPAPGTILEFPLRELAGRAGRVVTTSTHQLSLDRVVGLATELREAPLEGRFVGVGIEAVAHGRELSDAVLAALPGLRVAVGRAIRELADG